MSDVPLDTIRTMGWREEAENATTLEVRPESLRRMVAPTDLPAPQPALLGPPPEEAPEEPTIGKWAAVVLKEDRDDAAAVLAPLIAQRHAQGYLWKNGIISVNPSATGTLESWQRHWERAAGAEPPHYLLLVGGPERFPFEFQFWLDLRWATGRLDASDTPGGPFSWPACRRYAEKLVAFERGKIGLAAKPLFYSLQSDDSTRVSHDYLVLELAKTIPGGVTPLYGYDATVGNLVATLATTPAPRLVFMASHGVEFPADPVRWGALTDAAFRSRASDAVVSAQLLLETERFGYGSIIFTFACFSAGVPRKSTVSFLAGESDAIMDLEARVAPLPRQLLGHAQGPVAFIGHVDRVTAVAFQSSCGMAGITPYRHLVAWLRRHEASPYTTTVGRALGTLRENARRVGAEIAAALEQAAQSGGEHTIREAGRRWIGFHDYRGFILLGDPALTPPKP